MNLPHLRVFVKVRTLGISRQIPELPACSILHGNSAQIGQFLGAFISVKHYIILLKPQLLCQFILNRIQFLKITDRKIIPFVRIISLQIMVRRGCPVLVKPDGFSFREKRLEVDLSFLRRCIA